MISPPTDSPEMEAERMLLLPAGRVLPDIPDIHGTGALYYALTGTGWRGKRARGPRWSEEFLDACLASGAIVEYGGDTSPLGSWLRVATVIGFVGLIIAGATFGLWWR